MRGLGVLLVLILLGAGCGTTAAPAAPTSPPAPTAAPRAAPPAPAATPAPAAAKPVAPAKPATLEKINLGLTGKFAVYWPIFVANKKGYFAEQGLEMVEFQVANDSAAVQALVGGSVDVVNTTMDVVVRSVEKGAKVVAIGGMMNRGFYSLVTRPDIKTWADFKGKTLGTIGLNEGSTVLMKRMLAANGVKDGEYSLVVSGGSSARLAAIKNGSIAGAMLVQPFDFVAQDDGLPTIAYSTEYIKEYQFTLFAVNSDLAQKNPDRWVRFMRAIIKGYKWFYDPANRNEAAQILSEETKAALKHSLQSYDLYIKHGVLSKEGEVSTEGTKVVIDTLIEAGDLKPPAPSPEKFINISYFQKAKQ